MSIAAFICAYHEESRIGPAIAQLAGHAERVLLMLSRTPWALGIKDEELVPLEDLESDVEDRTAWLVRRYYPDVEIIEGDWPDEATQRIEGVDRLQAYDRVLMLDADEYYRSRDLTSLTQIRADHGAAPFIKTYWKTPEWRCEPVDIWTPPTLLNPKRENQFRRCRATYESCCMSVARVFCHHFSWVLSEAEGLRKATRYSHAPDIRPDWLETWRTWEPWDRCNVAPLFGQDQVAIYDPAPEEIVARYEAWQRVLEREGMAA